MLDSQNWHLGEPWKPGWRRFNYEDPLPLYPQDLRIRPLGLPETSLSNSAPKVRPDHNQVNNFELRPSFRFGLIFGCPGAPRKMSTLRCPYISAFPDPPHVGDLRSATRHYQNLPSCGFPAGPNLTLQGSWDLLRDLTLPRGRPRPHQKQARPILDPTKPFRIPRPPRRIPKQ